MKRLLVLLTVAFLLVGCSSNSNDDTYNGSVTDLSKKYLSKGYIVNIYRSVEPLSDAIEDMGKGNVKMTFQILVDYYSTIDYNNKNEYIKKQTVSNIKIKKTPKMGTIGNIYGSYQSYIDEDYIIKGSNNKYVKEFDTPLMYGTQTSLAVELDNVAYIDSSKYDDNITLGELYNALGITRDSVAITISFRVEFTTVGDKTLYKDYEIEMPTKNFDIAGTEFQEKFITEEVNQMASFLEK